MTRAPSLIPPGLDLPDLEPGSVWLVGAGPGDPGLLSVLALHGLSQAEEVVYDALVDRRVLELARPGAALIFAGKRGGKPSATQPDISRRLVALAQAGRRVLRLKGGDPMVFGRGGEEAQALAAAGIPYRVVPGITSGVGGLAYAGVPVGLGTPIVFVTGHDSFGEVPDGIDWAALAKGAPLIVAYMALTHLEGIAQRLIAEGRPPDEPVAIVSKASTDRQRVLETTLDRAAAEAEAAEIEPPALIAIGPAVRLRQSLDWLAALP